jgi:hypothetical protein
MELFIFWLACSLVPAVIASKKGRSGGGFFLLGVIISPILATIVAVAAKRNVAELDRRQLADGQRSKCPYCAELIKREASVCRYCGKDVHPATP